MAFEGFQLITNAVLETEDPERNIPRGIYGSILITSVICIAIALVAVGMLEPEALRGANEYALAIVAEPIFGRAGVVLVDLAARLATASAINATLFGSARLAGEMATEHFAPSVFSFRSRRDVPVVGMLVITVLAALLTGFASLKLIASFSSMTFLLVSIGVCVANLRLRHVTHAALVPVLLGIVLMAVTVTLLVIYLAANDPRTLPFCCGIYGVVFVAHLTFERVAGRD